MTKIRIKLREDVQYYLDCYSLNEIRKKFNDWEKEYPGYDKIILDFNYRDDIYPEHEIIISLIGIRNETNKEKRNRTAKDERLKSNLLKKEKEMLAKLKQKYE